MAYFFRVRVNPSEIFTSYDNPKGNAETDRMIRTFKEEIISPNEFSSLDETKREIGHWIDLNYNKLYVHSGLGYISPEEFEELYWTRYPQKEAA